MSRPRLRVAICGAGVGGLVLAAALSQVSDIKVDVYEAANDLAQAGPGVGLWPRSWKALQALGLAQDLARAAIIPPERIVPVAFNLRKGDDACGGTTFAQLATPGMLSFQRRAFQRALLRQLAAHACRTHTARRLVSFAQPRAPAEPIQLCFADGSAAACDVLVGADGVASAVRAGMLGAVADELDAQGDAAAAAAVRRRAQPVWSGTVAYQTTVPAAALRARAADHRALQAPYVYLGKNAELTAYPIARGTLVSIAAFVAQPGREGTESDMPVVCEVRGDEVAQGFVGWESDVQALLDCVTTASRWAVHTTAPLCRYAHRRVVLIGDAAHAMTPYQGAADGQAVEDALVLSAMLSHPSTTVHTLARATEIYDAVRRPEASRVAAISRDAGLLYMLSYPGLVPDDDGGGHERTLGDISDRIRRDWVWAWDTSAQADLENAVAMLQAEAKC